MIITYFRSSSFNQWGMCGQSYFLSYVLGIPQATNKKAEQGTIVHKVMEGLAKAKKAVQDGKDFIEDDVFGRFVFKSESVFSDGFVEYLFHKSYLHYSGRSTHEYTEKDRLQLLDWTWKPLHLMDGIFDPRKRDVVEPELHFDFEIPYDWAKYKYVDKEGKTIEGQLAMKGTIDLVTKVGDSIYESIDWKTGQRLDWGSRKEWPHNIKSYEKLLVDPQLRIYHYALHKTFPEVKQFIPTIYFINNHGTRNKPVPGGAFTMAYSNEDLIATMEMVKQRFEEIKNTSRPQLVKTWKCTSFCHFGKAKHSSNEINPRTGKEYTICEYIAKRVREVGIDKVIKQETHDTHHVNNYQSPGE